MLSFHLISSEHITFMDLPVVFRLDIARSGSRDMPYRRSDSAECRVKETSFRLIDERAVEFPRIDDRLVGIPARYGVTVGTGKLVVAAAPKAVRQIMLKSAI